MKVIIGSDGVSLPLIISRVGRFSIRDNFELISLQIENKTFGSCTSSSANKIMFLLLCLLFIVGYTEITNSFACLGKYFLSSNSSKIILNNILVQRIVLFFTFTNFLLLYCRKPVRVRLDIYPQGLKFTQLMTSYSPLDRAAVYIFDIQPTLLWTILGNTPISK